MNPSIDAILTAGVARGAVPQVVAVVADRDGTIYQGAAGPREFGGSEPVGPDTTFRLASMTKMITTAALLRLVDDGLIDLDAPAANYRPEFDDVKVLVEMDGETPILREPATRATVRQLASHTSGLAYWFWNDDIVAWEAATGTPNVLAGDLRSFEAPMVSDPGTEIHYGHNTDWLGLVIESVTGLGIDKALAQLVLDPLQMTSTTFQPSEEQRAQCVPVHVPGEDGAWIPTDIDWPLEPQNWPGGHGLYTTPSDYLRFQRMLLRGGELDGVRVLSEEMVDAAFADQTGGLIWDEVLPTASPAHSCDFPTGPGRTWGLGLMLNTLQEAGLRAPFSGAWAGLCNTHFWIDRTSNVTGAIYSQFLPFVTPDSMALYAEFERAVYSSLAAERAAG